ncbi:MAG: Hsp20/alpha crystallin family protein [Desulfatiglans sp.]|jgi:HSP20 family protein|nr:Hsp20/alpha crystallin family protein [Thermodesulfobacteriota bacterium]MEE4351827.1 Hsp20/alpha crystallin family protein [Desulfatiglans sp.]
MLLRRVSDWPRWGWTNPLEELERMKRELSQGFGRGLWREPTAGVFPLMNVTEDKDNYYVRAELPGLNADDLDLSVTGDTLSISGERKLPAEDENAQYHRREREAGRFSRVVTLPAQVATDKVQAQFTDGVLTVTLPIAESVKPKQITVKVA